MVWFVRLFPFSLSSFFFHLLVSFVMRLPQSLALLCVTRNTLRSGINRIKARSSNRRKMQPSRPQFGTSPPPPRRPDPRSPCDLDNLVRYHTWHCVWALHRKYLCLLCCVCSTGSFLLLSYHGAWSIFIVYICVIFVYFAQKKGQILKQKDKKQFTALSASAVVKPSISLFCFSLIVILDFIPQVLRARQC